MSWGFLEHLGTLVTRENGVESTGKTDSKRVD